MVDYSRGRATLPNAQELEAISALANKQLDIERKISDAEKALKDLKAEYLEVRTVALPEAMKQVGLTEFKLSNGAEIKIKDEINCNIKAENKPAAYEWVREHGHGAIIKNDVIFSFGAGQDERRDEAVKYAEEYDLPYSIKETIHANTLNAWARKQLETGEDDLPEDLISVFRYSVSKVKLPRR